MSFTIEQAIEILGNNIKEDVPANIYETILSDNTEEKEEVTLKEIQEYVRDNSAYFKTNSILFKI